MKRRHHSKNERKPVPTIHATIRLSNSMRTVDNKSLDRVKKLSSVSITRHRENILKKASIATVVDGNLKRKTNLNITIKSNQNNRRLSKLYQTVLKTGNIFESSGQQSVNSSNLIKKKIKKDEKNNYKNLATSEKSSLKSIEMDQFHHNTSYNKMTQINNDNDIKMIDIQSYRTNPVDDYHRRYKRKYNRTYFAYYCCFCSRLCVALSVFAGLLLGIGIASIIVELLTKTKAITTTTTTTATTTTISTSTSTTETTTLSILSIGSNDTLQGIWNTTAGDNSTLSTAGLGIGNYVPSETPENAFDHNCSTKFTSFGECGLNITLSSLTCGLNTGFYVILAGGAVVLNGLQFCTGNDNPPRDPITMTLEGSNQTGSTLMLGSSWSLIYNGSCGLDIDPGRGSLGQIQTISNNFIAYSSYRILITAKRGSDYALQYSELELFGY